MKYSLEDLLKKLVSFHSDKDSPEEMQKCFDFVKAYLKSMNLVVLTYSSNKFPSLVAAQKMKKHYKYILNGHLDVVPANYRNAFKATEKGNRIYGRGAADMKGVIAAMMLLMREVRNHNIDAALVLTSDEEIGGKNGIEYLLNNKKYNCDCAIIPDGGNDFRLTLKQKGVLQVMLRMKGRAAHGSRPWLGDNAIEKLYKVYIDIKKQFPQGNNEEHWETTVNLGKLIGGNAVNMVPEQAEMYLDFRYVIQKDKLKILTLLKKQVDRAKDLKFEIIVAGNSMEVSSNNTYLRKFVTVAEKEGVKLIPERSHTTSDARHFTEKKIPVIMTNPICSKGHIDNEWIDIQSLKKYYEIVRNFLISEKDSHI